MNTSQETSNILKAMIDVAPEITSISKTKQAYGYKYATLDSLIDMLRGVLPSHGLWFLQMPTRVGDKSVLTTRVIHTSGEWIEDAIEMTDTELQGKANTTQKLGASITYFRRYALSSIFGVASDEDVDGNIKSSQPPENRPVTPQPPENKPVTPQPKRRIEPINYITDDWNRRISNGEAPERILSDYACILKKDDVRHYDEFTPDECKVVAVALYKRNSLIR